MKDNNAKSKKMISTEDIIKDYVMYTNKKVLGSTSKEKEKLMKKEENYKSYDIGGYDKNNFEKSKEYDLKNPSNLQNFNNLNNLILENEKNSQQNPHDKNGINMLKNNVSDLEAQKNILESEIIEIRKKLKLMKKEDYNKKIFQLEKEKEETKKSANHYLHLCSQLAEEVIVLRNKLDNYSHYRKDK